MSNVYNGFMVNNINNFRNTRRCFIVNLPYCFFLTFGDFFSFSSLEMILLISIFLANLSHQILQNMAKSLLQNFVDPDPTNFESFGIGSHGKITDPVSWLVFEKILNYYCF